MKITKICKQCSAEFQADTRELNRGDAKFCSQSCSSIYNNARKPYYDYTCIACNQPFKSKSKHVKYCSVKCKNYNSVVDKNKYRYHLNKLINDVIGTHECFNCGWNRATCDVHHIIPRCDEGKNDYANLTILCPNCHRLVDKKIIDTATIPTVADKILEIQNKEST